MEHRGMHRRTGRIALPTALLLTGLSVPVAADQEAANRVYVTAGQYGQFYAKSIPDEAYGLKGQTKVYRVGKDRDTLLTTYPWYSPEVFLAGIGGSRDVYVVQMGPWHRGQEAGTGDPAIAFYKDGRLLRNYSTLEIAGDKDHVSRSVSHYTVFSELPGFRRPFGNQIVFDAKTHDGTVLSFDAETGALYPKEAEAAGKLLYEAQIQIARIKRKWYQQNKETLLTVETEPVTEEILKGFAPDEFPPLPEGYRYVPDTVWEPVQFEPIDAE
jgi:hypothetical protein